MNSRDSIIQVLNFIFFMVAQLVLVRNFVLFDTAFCFVYVAFLLLLPYETSPVLLLFIALGTGLLVDTFYDTFGVHAAACVLIAFLRPLVMKTITPRGGYEGTVRISLRTMGADWFIIYALLLIFIHHLALFLIEASNWGLLWSSILKALASTLFTGSLIIILQYFKK